MSIIKDSYALKRSVAFLLLFVVISAALQAKTKKFGTWVELEFSKEFLKKWEFSFIPEFRLQDDFSIDEYLFDSRLSFEPVKYLSFAAAYRLNTNVKNNGNETTNRFIFDATGQTGLGRLEASLRARFTNDPESDENISGQKFLRPRLKLEYDIRGSKMRPYTSCEIFRNLTEKDTDKIRYDIGVTRKLGDLHRIGMYYRLQDYLSGKNSIHILGIDYRLKF